MTGDEDGYATVWDLRTGHHVTTLYVDDYRDVNGVALSADAVRRVGVGEPGADDFEQLMDDVGIESIEKRPAARGDH